MGCSAYLIGNCKGSAAIGSDSLLAVVSARLAVVLEVGTWSSMEGWRRSVLVSVMAHLLY